MDTYERKYNEAVLRADEAVQNGCLDKDIFDIIFPPEESEDERMIKWIIKVLDEGYKAFFEMDYSKEDVLSWLEKLKDFNGLANWNEFKDKPVEVWNAYTKGVVIGLERGRQAVKDHPEDYGLEKQKEQKPVECSDCAKHLEGYISGRVDAEKKLLDEYGILIMPEGELRMKPSWRPSEEMLDSLRDTIVQTKGFSYSMYLPELYEQLKNL